MEIKHHWSMADLNAFYKLSLLELVSKAHQVHLQYHSPAEIHLCHLISIKTGGCSEDCKYCSQSAHYQTATQAQPLMSWQEVQAAAKKAIAQGATRICLGAAWREVRANKPFEEILKMIKGLTDLGVEVCCTLGLLKEEFAQQLKEAGLYAYNHNLDTSESFYPTIITTRTYQDRLETLSLVEKAGIGVCCGGIIGLGESSLDRLQLLHQLSQRNPHPESVPINRLTPICGTPLATQSPISHWELLRIIAIARILMPKSLIRLSSGRNEMSAEEQALCFLAGANSVFIGDKLLTVSNPTADRDAEMFHILGIKARPAFQKVS